VTGNNITVDGFSPSLDIANGQKLYFSSVLASEKYKKNPRDYWLGPNDQATILPGVDGKRGMPDFRGQIFYCPRTNETLNISMSTPRVLHKWGQSIFFCCFGCVTTFWTDPSSFIL
jgi:YHS domain-containing protein